MNTNFYSIKIPEIQSVREECFNFLPPLTESSVYSLKDFDLFFEQSPQTRSFFEESHLREYLKLLVFLVKRPQTEMYIHTDSLDVFGWNLVIPIQNADNTIVKFYECSERPDEMLEFIKDGRRARLYQYKDEVCREIESHQCSMDYAHMINIHKPHRVCNPTDENRITLLVRFDTTYTQSMLYDFVVRYGEGQKNEMV